MKFATALVSLLASFVAHGAQAATCGEGARGDGGCSNCGDCCSPYGWCGNTPEHCTSGNSPKTCPAPVGAKLYQKPDTASVNTYDAAVQFCKDRGGRLPTKSELCPSGSAPYFGTIEGTDSWTPVSDWYDDYVQTGNTAWPPCSTHLDIAGENPGWGTANDKPAGESDNVVCMMDGASPSTSPEGGDTFYSGRDYITAIGFVENPSNCEFDFSTAPTDGLNGDLNQGCGGKTIDVCVSSNSIYGPPITQLLLTKSYDGCPSGYRRAGWTDSLNGDLNQGSGGEYIYLCFTTNPSQGGPIRSITITKNQPSPDQLPVLHDNLNGDLNQGARGEYIFFRSAR